MTKAKARQRAKANAAKKAKRRKEMSEKQQSQPHPGKFDTGPNSISSPMASTGNKTFTRARRGSARSR
ncbi:MAG TPA: hypothetical protein DCS82_13340 [Rhodospirillaceae bacterium]|nr:hypothetical protein [Rhodospirillaceae bacterium]HAA92798.1 hypothetical protein [Rhodospirillaceae bacterium]HAT36692.1 hypothetical protein [Rhodospirillaceae bacterium]|tara:strand:+ start:321 stop:524 length:204 start_codon:yes stop_codon:yes gene_type:complete